MSFDIRFSDIFAMWHGFANQFPRSDRKAVIFEFPFVEGVFELIERSLAKTRQHRSPKRQRRTITLSTRTIAMWQRRSDGPQKQRLENEKSEVGDVPLTPPTCNCRSVSCKQAIATHTVYQSRQELCFTYHKKASFHHLHRHKTFNVSVVLRTVISKYKARVGGGVCGGWWVVGGVGRRRERGWKQIYFPSHAVCAARASPNCVMQLQTQVENRISLRQTKAYRQ